MTQTTTLTTPAPYVTRYSEEDWLDVFYLAVRNGNDRIGMLRKLAGVKLTREKEWSTWAIRYSFMGGVSFHLTAETCFACLNADRWLYWHHVIQVQRQQYTCRITRPGVL